MFVALIFWYQFYCGFSGSAMIDQWYLIFFNLMFSAFPQLITGTLDKDVSAETLQQLPQLYVNGQNSEVGPPAVFVFDCEKICVVETKTCSSKTSAAAPESVFCLGFMLASTHRLTSSQDTTSDYHNFHTHE